MKVDWNWAEVRWILLLGLRWDLLIVEKGLPSWWSEVGCVRIGKTLVSLNGVVKSFCDGVILGMALCPFLWLMFPPILNVPDSHTGLWIVLNIVARHKAVILQNNSRLWHSLRLYPVKWLVIRSVLVQGGLPCLEWFMGLGHVSELCLFDWVHDVFREGGVEAVAFALSEGDWTVELWWWLWFWSLVRLVYGVVFHPMVCEALVRLGQWLILDSFFGVFVKWWRVAVLPTVLSRLVPDLLKVTFLPIPTQVIIRHCHWIHIFSICAWVVDWMIRVYKKTFALFLSVDAARVRWRSEVLILLCWGVWLVWRWVVRVLNDGFGIIVAITVRLMGLVVVIVFVDVLVNRIVGNWLWRKVTLQIINVVWLLFLSWLPHRFLYSLINSLSTLVNTSFGIVFIQIFTLFLTFSLLQRLLYHIVSQGYLRSTGLVRYGCIVRLRRLWSIVLSLGRFLRILVLLFHQVIQRTRLYNLNEGFIISLNQGWIYLNAINVFSWLFI